MGVFQGAHPYFSRHTEFERMQEREKASIDAADKYHRRLWDEWRAQQEPLELTAEVVALPAPEPANKE
jgi:hypothetical protein